MWGKKLLRKSTAVNTTHVALSLGDGIFIHADTSCGVDLIFFPDLINKSDGNWKVIRHPELNDDVEVKIKQAGVFHLNKSYNYGIMCVAVNSKMQLSPDTTALFAVLSDFPFAFTKDL